MGNLLKVKFRSMRRKNSNNRAKPGVLIACEGLSGSGKSQGGRELFAFLNNKGYHAVLVEWNSNKLIRKAIHYLNRWNVLTPSIYSFLQWLSYLVSYYFKMLPLLKKDYVIIADRYVYTGLTRDIVNQSNQTLGKLISRKVRKPDLILFYDTELQLCYQRILERSKPLFHPNQRILKNKRLKNKDLYYLRKLQYQYNKLFFDPQFLIDNNVLFVSDLNLVNHQVEISLDRKFNLLIKRDSANNGITFS